MYGDPTLHIPEEMAELLPKVRFDPVSLEITVPEEIFWILSDEARRVISPFIEHGVLDLWKFLREGWSKHADAKQIYLETSAQGRFELHLVIAAYHHEAVHKIDLLTTPLGASWLCLLVDEFALLERYIPVALAHQSAPAGLAIYRHIERSQLPAALETAPVELQSLWSALEFQVMRTLAWGDLRQRRPLGKPTPGWQGLGATQAYNLLNTARVFELVEYGGVATIQPKDQSEQFIRPLAILEAKAISAALLWILSVSPDPGTDVAAYWRLLYSDQRSSLHHDYFFVLDTIAVYFGRRDFDDLIFKACVPEAGSNLKDQLRQVLLVATGICWYALHTPPMRDKREFRLFGLNPVIRLIVGLRDGPQWLRQQMQAEAGPTSSAQMATGIEQGQSAFLLQQYPVSETIARSRRVLEQIAGLSEMSIRHNSTRSWFRRVADLMLPQLEPRDHYNSLIGMPDDGNPWATLRSNEDADLLDTKSLLGADMMGWSRLRRELLLLDVAPSKIDPDVVLRASQMFGIGKS
ncbi:MAG: hypothetical protein CL484_00585 [Acidobacteria bacterium]|nr:hypothetical protein [Acidobacteriota bacterium]|tara:strand:- start:2963 stop:4528 length:1566 start_codon:yes stop_codon:yes gene_type:complete